MFTTW